MGIDVFENSTGTFTGGRLEVKAVLTNVIGAYTVNATYRELSGNDFFSVEATQSNDTVTVFIEEYMLDEEGVEVVIEATDELNQIIQTTARINNLYLGIDDQRILFGKPYPNPSNHSVTWTVTLPYSKPDYDISLQIVDFLGRPVYNLCQTNLAPGTHKFTWERTNDAGGLVSSGLYLLRLSVADGQQANYRIVLE